MKYFNFLKKRRKLIISLSITAFLLSGTVLSCYKYVVPVWNPDLHKGNMRPVNVGFVCRQTEPDDAELYKMIDEVIYQVLGEKGLSTIVKKGDKVVIKVNLAGGPINGLPGQKGRGTITDPRIVRYIAEKVRDIIGWEEPASLIVADALFHNNPNPSLKIDESSFKKGIFNSFHMARLQRSTNENVDPQDFCYDYNADGILDGKSGAVLVNLDSIGMNKRFLTVVHEPNLGDTEVYLPNILRTKEQAKGDKEYCDVLIGLPILKSHLVAGLTGALKLHYGFRRQYPDGREQGRVWHSGFNLSGNVNFLAEYLAAQHKARTYDFILMDAITGDRRGPHSLRYDAGFDYPTDYILTKALLASTDPVAIDTAASLLAGYKPESIPLMINAARTGVGVCLPEWIRLAGLDAFTRHRQFLMEEYDPAKMKEKYKNMYQSVINWHGKDINPWMPDGNIGVFGSYPFAEWGVAKNLEKDEYKPYEKAMLKVNDKSENKFLSDYSITGDLHKTNYIARIDFLVDGNPVDFIVKANKSDTWDIDLSKFRGKTVKCQVAAWDYSMNCTLSEAVVLQLP